MNLISRRVVVGVGMAAVLVLVPLAQERLVAQQAAGVAAGSATTQAQQSAEQTRNEFRQLLRQFPPSLGRVLLLDPTLLGNRAYLEPYPALLQFLTAHPQVVRDPGYFLGHLADSGPWVEPQFRDPTIATRRDAINAWRSMFSSLTTFAVFVLIVGTLAWLIRYIVDHRRWLRATKTQAEVHAKLLERMTTADDLKSYMESEAGQRFLQASPLALESANQQSVGAPFSRILWSVQVGVVMVALGVGFLVVRRGMEEEVAQMIGTWGTLAIALGVGFAISAAASYVISSRLGLLDHRRQ